MARKKSKSREVQETIEEPDWFNKLCEGLVVREGSGSPRTLNKLIKFKSDKTVQHLGFTEQEIQEHLKGLYIEMLRDLKNPVSIVAKEMIELKVAIEQQRLLEIARGDKDRGDDDILSPLTLKMMDKMHDLMKELNKYTIKQKKEITVNHNFNDESDGVIEGNWGRKIVDITERSDEEDEYMD